MTSSPQGQTLQTTARAMPILLVPAQDYEAAKNMGLPLTLTAMTAGEHGLSLTCQEAGLPPEAIRLHALGTLILSPQGQAEIPAVAQVWAGTFGSELPPSCDLTSHEKAHNGQGAALRQSVLLWLIESMAAQRQSSAARNVQLMRALCELRQTYAATLENVAARSLFAASLEARALKEVVTLTPDPNIAPIALARSAPLTQRIPASSCALCSLAISVHGGRANAWGAQGHLTVELLTDEDEVLHATWVTSAENLRAGWQKFTLARALEAAPRTPRIRLSWSGATPLLLDAAMPHPDPRYCSHKGADALDSSLALCVFASLPDADMTLPADQYPAAQYVFARRETLRAWAGRQRALRPVRFIWRLALGLRARLRGARK